MTLIYIIIAVLFLALYQITNSVYSYFIVRQRIKKFQYTRLPDDLKDL
jgi:hypothetical protein